MAKTIIDYIALDANDEARYREIITNAAERKMNAPKAARKPRAPQSVESKIAATEKRLKLLQEKLAAARAAAATEERTQQG